MNNDNKTTENVVHDKALESAPIYSDYNNYEDQYLPDSQQPPQNEDDLVSEPIYADRNESLLATNNPSPQEPEPDAIESKGDESASEENHEVEAEVNMYTSDNAAVQYQHYLLLLDALREERHEQEFQDFISSIMAEKGVLDDFDASPDSLAKIDLEMGNSNVDRIKKHCPKTFAAVSASIFKEDVSQDLIDAGIDLTSNASNVPLSFPYDVAIIKSYESKFPDPDRLPLKERLIQFKGVVSGAANSDSGKALISTTIFALAACASGVALPIATAIFATKMMENKKVQVLMSSLEEKTSKALIKMGFKEKSVGQRKKPIGERMKEISDTKWFKASKVPLAVCSIALGVGVLSITQFDIGADDLKAAADAVMNLHMPTAESVVATASSIYDASIDVTSGAIETVVNSGSDAYQASVDYTSSLIGGGAEFLDKAAVAMGDSVEIASNATEDIVNSFKEAFTDPEIAGSNFEVASSATTGGENVATTEGSTAATGSDAAAPTDAAPATTSYTVQENSKINTLWEIAEKHYTDTTGSAPSAQQIVEMVNDLGLEDPNKIFPGQTFEFKNDLSSYEKVESVTADWLNKAPETPTVTEIPASTATTGTSIPVSPSEQVAAMQKFADKQRTLDGIGM